MADETPWWIPPTGPITVPTPDTGWLEQAPAEISNNIDTLKTFASNPRSFVLGVVASAFVSGVLGLFEPALDALRIAVFGSSITTTSGMIGVADIPVVLLNIILDGVSPVGELIVGEYQTIPGYGPLPDVELLVEPGLIQDLGTWVSTTSESLGVLAFPVTVGVFIAVLVVMFRVLESSSVAVVESIPVVGPLILNLIGK